MGKSLRVLGSKKSEIQILREQVTELAASRNQLIQNLRVSEERFRATFELSSVGKAIVSAKDGRFLQVNSKYSEITGYSIEELSTKTFLEITHPEDMEISLQVFETTLRGFPSGTAERRYIRKNGHPIWTSISSAPIRDERGKIVSIVIAAQDISDRKTAEEKIRRSLRRYQELVDTVEGIVWEVNSDIEITFVSKNAEQILGYTVEQWFNEPEFWLNHIHPDDRERASSFCKEQAAKLKNHDLEYRMIAADGRIVWLRDLVHVIVENNQCIGLRGIMVDITLQKQTELKVIESEARKTAILESALDCIITIDHNGQILEFNQAAEKEFGYQRNDVIGKEMAQVIIPPDLRESHRKGLAHYLQTGWGPILGKRVELEALRADGLIFPIEVSITRINISGPPIFTGFIRNITERKQTQKALDQAKERLEERVQERTIELSQTNTFLTSLIENIPNMIFVKNAHDLRFIRFNKAGEELIGISREEIIGKNDHDLFPGSEADFFTSQDRKVLHTGSMLDITEEPIHTRFKGNRILHTKKIPLYNQQGKPEYLLGISEDITEKKQAEVTRLKLIQEQQARAEAERGIQLRDDFLSIAAHELRTPLTPIRMNLQLIRLHIEKFGSEIPKIEFLRRSTQGAEQEFERFLKLVENLLDVSRISAGRLMLDRREFDLTHLVKTIVNRFDTELKKAECDAHLELQEEVLGRWDPSRIEQVIVNLLSNAMKYGAEKPIEIKVSKKGTDALLQIKDHGIGIAKEDQGKIFHRFERVAPLKHFGGFGLGLFVAREIVEAHGGRIQLDSELNQGSSFTVELPIIS